MKIELQEPFKSIWKYGYLRINRENRKALDLFNSNENRTTISYARYLMCVKLGYILSSEFEVDHIDNDKTNDDVNNLQVLTINEHKEKTAKQKADGILYIECICAGCNKSFSRSRRIIESNKSDNDYCSLPCYREHVKPNPPIPKTNEETILKIKEMAVTISSREISKLLNVSKSTVNKYR